MYSNLDINNLCFCFLFFYGSMVVYECCPGYMKLEGMKGCPAGMAHTTVPICTNNIICSNYYV